MNAIETTYRDVRFRSRLEARWAVFFDALGVRWEYEPEPFRLSTGEIYLPDFWLASFPHGEGTFVEIKPEIVEPRGVAELERHFDKAVRFSREHGRAMWLCDGSPECRVTHIVALPEHGSFTEVVPLADQAASENRFYTAPGYEANDGRFDADFAGERYLKALAAVRSHRFWSPSEGATT